MKTRRIFVNNFSVGFLLVPNVDMIWKKFCKVAYVLHHCEMSFFVRKTIVG